VVFNRLADPESKLEVLHWLKEVAVPRVKVEQAIPRSTPADDGHADRALRYGRAHRGQCSRAVNIGVINIGARS
jgi:hypothetical protein